MAQVAEDLLIRIDATTEQLRRQLKAADQTVAASTGKMDRQLAKVDQRFDKLNRAAGFAAKALTGYLAVFSVGAVARFAGQQLEAADAIGKAASVASVTTDSLQELRYAFGQLAAISDGQVDKALQDFNRRLGQARAGSGEAKEAFDQLFAGGARQFESTEQALDAVIARLSEMEDGADRAMLAARFFGEEAGPKLAAALSEGSGVVNQLRQDAHDLNMVLGADITANAATIRDEFDKAQRILNTAFMSALNEATPVLIKMADMAGKIASALTTTKTEALQSEIENYEERLARAQRNLESNEGGLLGSLLGDSGARQKMRESALAEIDFVTEQIRLKRAELDALLNPSAESGVDTSFTPGQSTESPDLEKLREQTEKRLQMIRESFLSERELEIAQYEERREWLTEVNEEFFEGEAERLEMLEALREQHQERLTEIDRKSAEQRQQIEEQAMQTIQGFYGSTWSYAIGMLQTFAGESKAVALAVIAIEKAQAIARATMNTATAVTAALAMDPTGALAARVAAIGKLQIGLIAATGLMQAAQAMDGGAQPGSAANPIHTTGGSTSVQPQTATPTQRIYVEFEGDDDQRVPLREFRQQIRRIKEENPDAEVVF